MASGSSDRAVSGFPPVVGDGARLLIVGSMPGVRSLQERRYYAHPQNAFWPIVGAACGVGPEVAYERRLAVLVRAGIALWDVMARCVRAGSLDADIEAGSVVANDFVPLFAGQPTLCAVLCNGKAAHRAFLRYAAPQLAAAGRRPAVELLPSTSPAHAAMDLAGKRAVWTAAMSRWLDL
jgi:TDG/mug DNA glycosylase family protein